MRSGLRLLALGERSLWQLLRGLQLVQAPACMHANHPGGNADAEASTGLQMHGLKEQLLGQLLNQRDGCRQRRHQQTYECEAYLSRLWWRGGTGVLLAADAGLQDHNGGFADCGGVGHFLNRLGSVEGASRDLHQQHKTR